MDEAAAGFDARIECMAEALKNAILIEIKGQQLYQQAALRCSDAASRRLFGDLAREEDQHVAVLQAQYRHLVEGGELDLEQVLSKRCAQPSRPTSGGSRRAGGRGDFEMAVISIGCDLERQAIAFYRREAERCSDPELRKLFEWLAGWEVEHLEQLSAVEKILIEEYWTGR